MCKGMKHVVGKKKNTDFFFAQFSEYPIKLWFMWASDTLPVRLQWKHEEICRRSINLKFLETRVFSSRKVTIDFSK